MTSYFDISMVPADTHAPLGPWISAATGMAQLSTAYYCFSGKLWYLQHICVGDVIVYHSYSDICMRLAVMWNLAFS